MQMQIVRCHINNFSVLVWKYMLLNIFFEKKKVEEVSSIKTLTFSFMTKKYIIGSYVSKMFLLLRFRSYQIRFVHERKA